jgi:dipeptidyl aminopeptidase/acylaminoacyl peptidase
MLACIVCTASAASADGARLAITRWGLHPEAYEVLSLDPIGSAELKIAAARRDQLPAPYPFVRPAWSSSGDLVAFTGVVSWRQRRRAQPPPVGIFVATAGGGDLHLVPGTREGFAPVFSPDGGRMAFSRVRRHYRRNRHGGEDLVYESVTAWLLDLADGEATRLTPWRNGLENAPSSFSPDGRTLAVTRRTGASRYEAVGLHLDGRPSTVLARGGLEPIFSPDGSRIALLRGHRRVFRERHREGRVTTESKTRTVATDLFVMNADGSGLRRLTRTSQWAESGASWDPSGERLAYTQTHLGAGIEDLLGIGDVIMEANADGSCPTPVFSDLDASFSAPVWQPGPGREAGRIEC